MGRVMHPPKLIERRMQIDEAAIKRYADITQDYNPIHLDVEFAAKTPMRGIIAHGMLSLSLVWQSLQATLGVDRMAGAEMDIRFIKPVRLQDWVVAGGERADGENTYRVWVRAEGGGRCEDVISGTVTLNMTARTAEGQGAKR